MCGSCGWKVGVYDSWCGDSLRGQTDSASLAAALTASAVTVLDLDMQARLHHTTKMRPRHCNHAAGRCRERAAMACPRAGAGRQCGGHARRVAIVAGFLPAGLSLAAPFSLLLGAGFILMLPRLRRRKI